jgi:hypothetical protein
MNLDELTKIIQDHKTSKSATKEYLDTIKNCLKHLNSTNIIDIYNNFDKILDLYKNKNIKYKTTKFTNLKRILELMTPEQLININTTNKFKFIDFAKNIQEEEIEYDDDDEEEEEPEPINISNKLDVLNNRTEILNDRIIKHEQDIVLLKNMFISLINDNTKTSLLNYSVNKLFEA